MMKRRGYIAKKALVIVLAVSLLLGSVDMRVWAAETADIPEQISQPVNANEAEDRGTGGTQNGNDEDHGNVADSGLSADVEITGTDSLGEFLADALSDTVEDFQSTPGSHVLSIKVQEWDAGKFKVKAEYESQQDCILAVGLYDEKGTKLLCSGNAQVKAEDTEAEIEIVGADIPEYFILKGYLIENDTYRPLCSEFNCTLYTEAMQKVLAMKATDEEIKDRVYNLDQSDEENFVVYKAETVTVSGGDIENKLTSKDEENLTYTFDNPDATLSAVKAGTILSYETEDGLLILKVVDVQDNGDGTITLSGEKTSIEDVFDYVKINTHNLGEVEIDDSTCDEGVTYIPTRAMPRYNSFFIPPTDQGDVEVELLSASFKLEKTIAQNGSGSAEVKISGGLELDIGFEIEYYYNIPALEFYTETSLSYESKVEVSISGTLKKEFELAKISIRPIAVVEVALTPTFIVEGNVKGSASASISGSVGCKITKSPGFNVDIAIEDISENPHCDVQVEGEVEIFIGFSLKPAIGVISTDVAKIELEGKAGGDITAKMAKQLATTASERHACKLCIEGEISAKLEVSAGAKLFNKDWLKVEKNLVGITFPLFDFYYSFDHKEFGKGKCPYKEYLVTFQAKDQYGRAVPGAQINELVAGSNGAVKEWMTGGNQTVTASKSGYQTYWGSKYINSACFWQLLLNKDSDEYTATVSVRDTAGTPVKGAAVSMADRTVRTGDDGKVQITVEQGTYILTVKKAFYKKVSSEISLNQDRTVEITLEHTGDEIGASRLSMGGNHSAVVTDDGSLYIWGGNWNGQLGDGTDGFGTAKNTPTKIMDNAVTVGLGGVHSAAITEDGSLYTWGDNVNGKLGDGTEVDKNTPIKIMDNVVMVSLGGDHSAAITEDGSLYTWGYNISGQLGDGTDGAGASKNTPTKIMDNVVMVSLGDHHSAAITEDGSLYTWGENRNGQLGDGTTVIKNTPTKIMDNVAMVSLGGLHSAAVTEDGSLYTWGYNGNGQLGDGTDGFEVYKNTPTKIMDNVVTVSLGFSHSAAVTRDGSLYEWGQNFDGQLGDGTAVAKNTPIKVMDNVATVSNGGNHSAVITGDDSLYIWGSNTSGELGNGTSGEKLYKNTPIKIMEGFFSSNPTFLFLYGFLYNPSSASAVNTYSEEPLMEEEDIPEPVTSPAVTLSDVEIMQNAADGTETISAKGLNKQSLYNLYVVKSALEGEDLLESSNLLYLGQGVSGADGNLSLTYQPRESCDAPVYLLVSMERDDISEADVTIDALDYTGTEVYVSPVVTWHGETLTAGTDYELRGDFAATEIGSYTVVIHGINRFTGDVSVDYQVRCPHAVYEWEVLTEATCSEIGSRQKKCSLCGEDLEIGEIEKLAHTAGEWEVLTEATETTAGKKQKKCTVCGEVIETEEIAKLTPSGEGDNTDGDNGGGDDGSAQYTYRIVYSLGGGENAASNPAGYNDATAAVSLAAPTRAGYEFDGWYSDSAFKKKVTEIAKGSTGNVILYAKWTAHKYTIMFDKNTGSIPVPVTGTMKALAKRTYDTTFELPANKFKRRDYLFIGWGLDENGTDVAFRDRDSVKNLTAEKDGSVTLYARWLNIPENGAYTITYRLNGGANALGNPSYYTEGTIVTLQNPTKAGYEFGGWYTDAKCSAKKKVETVDPAGRKNLTLYAKWTPRTYKIEYKPNPTGITGGNSKVKSGIGGSVDNTMADTANVKSGGKVTLQANKFQYRGYTFAGWNTEPDGSGTFCKNKAGVKDLGLQKDGTFQDTVTLYAQWTETQYTIAYKLGGGKWPKGTAYPKSFTINSDEIVLAAPVRNKYTFAGWYTTKKCTEGTRVESIKTGSAGKITLYAKWEKNGS